jgi:Ca-activated chloride channel family protein
MLQMGPKPDWRGRLFMGRGLGWALLLVAISVGSPPRPSFQEKPVAAPQQLETPQKPNEAQERIRVNSDLVVLSVMVKDHDGNLVPDLKREEFRLFDDGVGQKVDVFSEEGLPLSLVILVDKDLKATPGMAMVRSLRAVMGGMSSLDEASVCRFDMLFYPGDGFTGNTDKLLADLKEAQKEATPAPEYVPQPLVLCTNSTTGPPCVAAPTRLGARPSKALDDAVYSSAELLQGRGRDRRKLILVVSDGVNEPKLNHRTYEQVIKTLLRNNISVYSLALGSETARRRFSRLAGYASESGGDIYYARKSSALEQLYSRITDEARHEYTLAYVPLGNHADSNYHKIQVRITREGLIAETREGYYTAEDTPRK